MTPREALLHGIPYDRSLERETRASVGAGDHESRAIRRKRPKTIDRVCPPVPALGSLSVPSRNRFL
jgi:hypothetical protein